MVKGGGLDRYWTDTEVFRCKGGNQQLALRFFEHLNAANADTVVTSAPVSAIERRGAVTQVSVTRPGGTLIEEADDVVLAIPPSTWPRIEFKNSALAAHLAAAPALGCNVKYLMQLNSRFWREFASSPTLTADGPVDLTWETTEDDPHGDFVMVAFSGADHARQCIDCPPQERQTLYMNALQPPYPTIEGALKQDQLADWPADPWTCGSYYFPRPGEVTRWGPVWKDGINGERWLHFAGEHTSFAFVGYMEGALSSGFRLARRLMARDGIFPAHD
jgi:monoamine oxidase